MPTRKKITITRKWRLKFNSNVSIGENNYTTVGKQLKNDINCSFSVQYVMDAI